jgi:hypothetical protein
VEKPPEIKASSLLFKVGDRVLVKVFKPITRNVEGLIIAIASENPPQYKIEVEVNCGKLLFLFGAQFDNLFILKCGEVFLEEIVVPQYQISHAAGIPLVLFIFIYLFIYLFIFYFIASSLLSSCRESYWSICCRLYHCLCRCLRHCNCFTCFAYYWE